MEVVALLTIMMGATVQPSRAQIADPVLPMHAADSAQVAQAQVAEAVEPVQPAADSFEPVVFRQRNMSGPRLGVTVVSDHGEIWNHMNSQGYGRVISQFGWHFERQIAPRGGGPQFVIEAVPMVGGVEYGKIIPGITGAMGVRFPNGFEFGLGPNLVAVGGDKPVQTALVIAVGKCFDYGGVSLPVNVALTTSPDGNRASLIVGYAIQKTGN